MKLAVAMPVCCRNASEIRVGYALEALAFQQFPRNLQLDVYIRDEGPVPLVSDRWTRLMLDLLAARGHRSNYLRRAVSQGIGVARHDLLAQIPPNYDRILLLDDDMILMPAAVHEICKVAETAGEFGFVQGTKLEVDAQRDYWNDVNVLNHRDEKVEAHAPLLRRRCVPAPPT